MVTAAALALLFVKVPPLFIINFGEINLPAVNNTGAPELSTVSVPFTVVLFR